MKLGDILDKAVCKKSPYKVHSYKLIKESGYRTGTPLWKCEYCNKTIKSN